MLPRAPSRLGHFCTWNGTHTYQRPRLSGYFVRSISSALLTSSLTQPSQLGKESPINFDQKRRLPLPSKHYTTMSSSDAAVEISSQDPAPPANPGKLTIAVTGGLGLVGQGVARSALDDGHTVVLIDTKAKNDVDSDKLPTHEKCVYRQANLRDLNSYLRVVEGCDALIHLAAVYTLRAPDGTIKRFVPEHEIHNTNTTMSWNALTAAKELGINRVVMASSVNAVGMIFSNPPRFDYVPLNEDHPMRPEDAYSVSKQVTEFQGDAFARRYPSMRIASLRFHWVIPDSLAYDPVKLSEAEGTPKDLWGWVSISATARACLLGLTAPESTFPPGHEAFFIVAPTAVQRTKSLDLLKEHYPELTDIRREYKGNEGFYDTSKAKNLLGWEEKAFFWSPETQ